MVPTGVPPVPTRVPSYQSASDSRGTLVGTRGAPVGLLLAVFCDIHGERTKVFTGRL